MKKSTKVGYIFTILSVVVIGIGIFFAVLVKNEKTILANMEIVKRTYTSFSGDIIDNYHIRTTIVEKLDNFNNEKYPEEHEEFKEYLEEYNNIMKSLNNNVSILEDKCSVKYKDNQTNIFCSYYQQLYETVNNLYVVHLTRYNDLIKGYNENSEEDYQLFEMTNKEKIDFDKNGYYEGDPKK